MVAAVVTPERRSLQALSPGLFAAQREDDPESQTKYYRARSMDPRIGRFLEKDPVRWSSSANPFVYANNSPTDRIDPSGAITIIVHGTFADTETWWRDTGAFGKALN